MSADAADAPRVPPNSVLGKATLILSAFRDSRDVLRLVDLSTITGIHKASVYRLAQELVSLGMLERAGDGYVLGYELFSLGQRAAARGGSLRMMARPIMADLYAATRGTTHLATIEQDRVFFLEKVGGIRGVHKPSEVGGRLPLTCTATGKVLLAYAPEREKILNRIEAAGLEGFTPASTSSISELKRELDKIVATQYVAEYQQVRLGFKSFAVPVSSQGTVVAALGVTVPLERTDEQALIKHVRAAAAAIRRAHESYIHAALRGGQPHD